MWSFRGWFVQFDSKSIANECHSWMRSSIVSVTNGWWHLVVHSRHGDEHENHVSIFSLSLQAMLLVFMTTMVCCWRSCNSCVERELARRKVGRPSIKVKRKRNCTATIHYQMALTILIIATVLVLKGVSMSHMRNSCKASHFINKNIRWCTERERYWMATTCT